MKVTAHYYTDAHGFDYFIPVELSLDFPELYLAEYMAHEMEPPEKDAQLLAFEDVSTGQLHRRGDRELFNKLLDRLLRCEKPRLFIVYYGRDGERNLHGKVIKMYFLNVQGAQSAILAQPALEQGLQPVCVQDVKTGESLELRKGGAADSFMLSVTRLVFAKGLNLATA